MYRTRFVACWPHTWAYAYKPGPQPQAQAPKIGKTTKKKKTCGRRPHFPFLFSGDPIWLIKQKQKKEMWPPATFFLFGPGSSLRKKETMELLFLESYLNLTFLVLSSREGAIDRLVNIYKKAVYKTGVSRMFAMLRPCLSVLFSCSLFRVRGMSHRSGINYVYIFSRVLLSLLG